MFKGLKTTIIDFNGGAEIDTYRKLANKIKEAVEETFDVTTNVLEGWYGFFIPIPKADGSISEEIEGQPAIHVRTSSPQNYDDSITTSTKLDIYGCLMKQTTTIEAVWDHSIYAGFFSQDGSYGGGSNYYYYTKNNWTLRLNSSYNTENTPFYNFAIYPSDATLINAYFTLSLFVTELEYENEKKTTLFNFSNNNGTGISITYDRIQTSTTPTLTYKDSGFITYEKFRAGKYESKFLYMSSTPNMEILSSYMNLTYEKDTEGHPTWRDGLIINGKHYLVPMGIGNNMTFVFFEKPE